MSNFAFVCWLLYRYKDTLLMSQMFLFFFLQKLSIIDFYFMALTWSSLFENVLYFQMELFQQKLHVAEWCLHFSKKKKKGKMKQYMRQTKHYEGSRVLVQNPLNCCYIKYWFGLVFDSLLILFLYEETLCFYLKESLLYFSLV